jgi:hypothetical protein
MLTGNLIISGLFILLGIGICTNSYFLDLGTLARPNAGLLPFGIGILLILCSLILFFNYLLPIINNRQTDNTKVWPNVNFRKVFFVLLCLLIYMTLLGELGLPKDTMEKLQDAFGKASQDKSVAKMLHKLGYTEKYMPKQEFEAFVAKEIEKFKRVVKEANIQIK